MSTSLSFSNNVQSLDQTISLLTQLTSSWGASSAETRRLALVRTRCEQEAKVLDEIANALAVEGKPAEELAQNVAFLRRTAPNVDISRLENKVEELVLKYQEELTKALTDEDIPTASSRAAILEKCERADLIEQVYEEVRSWQVETFKDWCAEARRERVFAAKTMPNSHRAASTFEKAALAAIKEMATFLKEDEPRKRAARVKGLSEALPDLKDACGSSLACKSAWDSLLLSMKAQTKLDAERAAKEHPPAKWSSTFHGIDPACLEVFGLLARAGTTSDPPQSVLVALLDRLRDSLKGKENDLFVLLGCCNSLDYILSYLDEYTPERTKALAMLRSAKESFVKKACSELDRNGESFVKQSGRFLQVQNPVLRTELRMEVSKAWKASNRSGRVINHNDSNSSLGDGSFHGSTTEVGGLVAMFFEGPSRLGSSD